TWDRNFDYMNDVDLLVKTGRPIVEAGMHHQACVALMGLPFISTKAHTPEFYIKVAKDLLSRDIQVDSICLKDASGTTPPQIVYEACKGIRKIMPPEMPLWHHNHDTASTAVACNMAAIEAGADGIDLSVRPLASGTVQPDVRSMAHALKGTGYSLDIDDTKMGEIENILTEGLKDYEFNPVVTSADARVVGFPMPGGAIGPNVHMMVKAGILSKYGDVLAEFPVVVEAGGSWTSVTPGSQQYWLQAFNNVLYGRWQKIDPGYGKAVLGYFGKTPLPPDPEVIKMASEQLKLPVLTTDPLEKAPDILPEAKKALEERGLPSDEKSVFLVAAAMVPGKNMELNEGIRLLSGKPKIDLPLKKKEEPAAPAAAPAAAAPAPAATALPAGPITTLCDVAENGTTRRFKVTIEIPGGSAVPAAAPALSPAAAAPAPSVNGKTVDVYSPFEGEAPLVELHVKVGDRVTQGQVLGAVEAMKANHNFKAPVAGTVAELFAGIGDDVASGKPILSIKEG
ncbi:biotin attachment protein, partial [bacterium]|nr:biotin attachment protein [bacterium]